MERTQTKSEGFLHDVRHALVGMYYERKKLLNDMLCIAETLESRYKPTFLKSLWITLAVRRQMESIRRIDKHLERAMSAVLKEGRKNK